MNNKMILLTLVLDHRLNWISLAVNFSHSIRRYIRPGNKEIPTALMADRNWTPSAERDKTHIHHVSSWASIVVINQERTKSGDSKWANFTCRAFSLWGSWKVSTEWITVQRFRAPMSDTACCDGFHMSQSHTKASVENSEVGNLIENNNLCVFEFHANLTYCLSSICGSELDPSCKEVE